MDSLPKDESRLHKPHLALVQIGQVSILLTGKPFTHSRASVESSALQIPSFLFPTHIGNSREEVNSWEAIMTALAGHTGFLCDIIEPRPWPDTLLIQLQFSTAAYATDIGQEPITISKDSSIYSALPTPVFMKSEPSIPLDSISRPVIHGKNTVEIPTLFYAVSDSIMCPIGAHVFEVILPRTKPWELPRLIEERNATHDIKMPFVMENIVEKIQLRTEREQDKQEIYSLRSILPTYPDILPDGTWTAGYIAAWATAEWGGRVSPWSVNKEKRAVCGEESHYLPIVCEKDMKKVVDRLRVNCHAAKRARQRKNKSTG